MAEKMTSRNLASANLAVSTISSAVSTAVSIAALTALLNRKSRKVVSRNTKVDYNEEPYVMDVFMCGNCHTPLSYEEVLDFVPGGENDLECEMSPSDCGYSSNYGFTCPFCGARTYGETVLRPIDYTSEKMYDDDRSFAASALFDNRPFDAGALFNRKGSAGRPVVSRNRDSGARARLVEKEGFRRFRH